MNDALGSWARDQIVLAVDTSCDVLCCALGRITSVCADAAGASNDSAQLELLASADHVCRRQGNVELTTTMLQVLAEAELSMADVDAVVVGRGPGSFTGVRIGIATAKGVARGLGVPLYGASTLDACAWNVWAHGVRGTVGIVCDAMRGEVYPGIYQLHDSGASRSFAAETVSKAADAAQAWASAFAGRQQSILLAGDGLVKYREIFCDAGFTSIADPALWRPSGEGLLRAFIASMRLDPEHSAAHLSGEAATVLPIYTRLSDAEENERRRLGMAEPASARTTGVAEQLAGSHAQLRPAGVNDVKAIAELEALAYAHDPHRAWTALEIYDDLSSPGTTWWVAHDKGTVIAFATATLAADNADVSDVVVAEAYRRRGIARRLLERVCYDMQVLGALSATLEVAKSNDAARALYASAGFVEVGVRRDYYGAGNDALTMRATLPLIDDDVARAYGKADKATPESRKEKSHTASEVNDSVGHVEASASCSDAVRAKRIADASPLVLAIETSCDETAMALIDGKGSILANVVATQIDFHARFGGVVPEIASRKHTEAIVGVYDEVMERAARSLGIDSLSAKDLAAVGVTAGPGLVGALVVGVAFAKGLCAATGRALVPVHHLEGHLLANLFATPDLKPPFVASLVSGGNTLLVHVRAWGDYHVLGGTIDDAVGEAFDKVAKALGLGYPGGPVISRLAATGNPRAIAFPRAMLKSGDYRFSLSGLKTAVITYIEQAAAAGRALDLPDLAASFTAAVVDVQVAKAVTAVEECGVTDFCVGGGVAANPQLRAAYKQAFSERGVRVSAAPLVVCGDNGAMIAVCALRNLRAGLTSDLSLDADPNAALGTWTTPDLAPLVNANAWPNSV